MKYYHIIYNSSEKPMDGGVGFGIRTATEGTPQSLLNAIKNIKFFTDDWESYENKPTPAQMKENPSSMESIAKNYAVTSITDELGTLYYVIARRAYVGFDYSFYKNGMPTRPGNYVIDYYVFDAVPESSAYEILFENPKQGSNHFIPKSVQPTEDNEEMRVISVGSQPGLPVEERPFCAEVSDSLDKDVVKLFFTYLHSKSEGKKLVIQAGREKSLKLVADFYRMLRAEDAKGIRTYVNLRGQGTNDSFDLYFIHEDYPHQIYPGLYDFVDWNSAAMPDTVEARTFGKDMESYVTQSFEENKSDVHDTLKWLLMPEYGIVKSMSKQTIDSFFRYCIQPGNFMYDDMKDSKDGLNEEFLPVLCSYTKRSKENAERFNLLVTEAMNEVNADNVVAYIEDYNKLLSVGFALDDITAAVKKHVCAALLTDAKTLGRALDALSFAGIEKFFVKSIFEEKNSFIDSNVLDKYMLRLYKLFLTEDELAKKNSVLYNRFLKRDMDDSLFLGLVDDMHGDDNDAKIGFFNQVLLNRLKPYGVIWKYLNVYLPKVSQAPDFTEIFKDRIGEVEYAQMFYYSVKERKSQYNSVAAVKGLTSALKANPALKRLVDTNYSSDGIYSRFYDVVYAVSDSAASEAVGAIKENVLDVFGQDKDGRFKNLAFYFFLVSAPDRIGQANLKDSELFSLYKIIVDKKNNSLFAHLLPKFKDLVKKHSLEAQTLVGDYFSFNQGAHCEDMLRALVSSPDQTDMMGAIIRGLCNKNFKDAYSILDKFGLESRYVDKFLMEYYEKDYRAYLRKNRIKAAMKSVKDAFVKLAHKFSKKKSDNPKKDEKAGLKDK